MKKVKLLVAISLLLLVTTSIACQPAVPQEPEILPATIQDIRVEIADTHPPQVMAYIVAEIPDACTEFHDLKTERSDNSTINIDLTVKHTPGKSCKRTEGSILMQNVNLGSDFVSSQTYTINVNDKMTTFVME